MKFLALQVLALCGLAALAAQPTLAADELFTSTCDMECLGPYSRCAWRAIAKETTKAECDSARAKCLVDCIAKNGIQKYVFPVAQESKLTPLSKYNHLRQ